MFRLNSRLSRKQQVTINSNETLEKRIDFCADARTISLWGENLTISEEHVTEILHPGLNTFFMSNVQSTTFRGQSATFFFSKLYEHRKLKSLWIDGVLPPVKLSFLLIRTRVSSSLTRISLSDVLVSKQAMILCGKALGINITLQSISLCNIRGETSEGLLNIVNSLELSAVRRLSVSQQQMTCVDLLLIVRLLYSPEKNIGDGKKFSCSVALARGHAFKSQTAALKAFLAAAASTKKCRRRSLLKLIHNTSVIIDKNYCEKIVKMLYAVSR